MLSGLLVNALIRVIGTFVFLLSGSCAHWRCFRSLPEAIAVVQRDSMIDANFDLMQA